MMMNQWQVKWLLLLIGASGVGYAISSNCHAQQQPFYCRNAGAEMSITAAGRIASIVIGGEENVCPQGMAMSGFSLADQSRSPAGFKPLDCQVSLRGDSLYFHWSGDDLEFNAQMQPIASGWHIKGSLLRMGKAERFVSLRFGIPLAVGGWRWWDHVASSRAMVTTQNFAPVQPKTPSGNLEKDWVSTGIGSGPNGRQDIFPITAVSNDRSTVAYAVPMDKQYFRYTMYDAKSGLFALTYDFAMIDGQVNYSHEIPLDFYVLTPPGKWGLRAAIAEYFARFPQWAGSGRMVPQPWGGEDIGDLGGKGAAEPPLSDFGFRATGRSGDLTARLMTVDIMGWPFIPYIEPTMYQQYHGDAEPNQEPSLEIIKQRLSHNASCKLSDVFVTKQWSDPAFVQAQSKALAVNPVMGPDGKMFPPLMRFGLGWVGGSGCSATFAINLEPQVPAGMGETRLTDCLYRPHLSSHNSLTHPETGGQYLDSFGYRESGFALADFNPITVKYSSLPPTFKAMPLKPCTTIAGGAIAWCEQLRRLFTPKQQELRTNTGAIFGPLPWHCMDYTGPEGVEPGHGLFSDVLYNERAFMYHKPISVLNVFVDYTFLKGLLLTGTLPGNHVNGEWIGNIPAAQRQPIRAYFRKLMPMARLLHRLEWQPVTYAEGDASPRLERYGNPPGPAVFVMVNEANVTRKVTTSVDAKTLGLPPKTWSCDPLNETPVETTWNGTKLEISTVLAPMQTAVAVVGDAAAHQEFMRMAADDKLDDIRVCLREYMLRKHKMHPLMAAIYGVQAKINEQTINGLRTFADQVKENDPISRRIKDLANEAAELLRTAMMIKPHQSYVLPSG